MGSPIAHSLSPALHRAAYASLGLPGWTYDAYEVDADGLPDALRRARPGVGGRLAHHAAQARRPAAAGPGQRAGSRGRRGQHPHLDRRWAHRRQHGRSRHHGGPAGRWRHHRPRSRGHRGRCDGSVGAGGAAGPRRVPTRRRGALGRPLRSAARRRRTSRCAAAAGRLGRRRSGARRCPRRRQHRAAGCRRRGAIDRSVASPACSSTSSTPRGRPCWPTGGAPRVGPRCRGWRCCCTRRQSRCRPGPDAAPTWLRCVPRPRPSWPAARAQSPDRADPAAGSGRRGAGPEQPVSPDSSSPVGNEPIGHLVVLSACRTGIRAVVGPGGRAR